MADASLRGGRFTSGFDRPIRLLGRADFDGGLGDSWNFGDSGSGALDGIGSCREDGSSLGRAPKRRVPDPALTSLSFSSKESVWLRSNFESRVSGRDVFLSTVTSISRSAAG